MAIHRQDHAPAVLSINRPGHELSSIVAPPPWTADALCAQVDPELFFPNKGGSTREAKAICQSCDVREQCLEAALDRDERFGIWGGLSERERRGLKKNRQPTTTPDPVPTPAVPLHLITKDPITMAETQPSYADQIITVLAATEGHPDPTVRAARKVVANALVALNKTLQHPDAPPSPVAPMAPIAPIAPIAPKATRQGRHRNHYNPAQRIAALGVTSKSIREWATDQDLDAPTRGVLPAHLLDAYEAAHQQTAAAS